MFESHLGFEINSSNFVSFATGKLSRSSWSVKEAGLGVAGGPSLPGRPGLPGGSLGSPTVILMFVTSASMTSRCKYFVS